MAQQHIAPGKQVTVVGPAKINIVGKFEKFAQPVDFALAATPTLTGLVPNTADAPVAADLTMDANGTNFTQQSVIVFGGAELPTTFVSAAKLQAAVSPAANVAGVVPVLVRTFTHETAPQNFTFT